jgi:hypothetical protein
MKYKINDFTSDEINTMENYISKNVPSTMLPNLYILTDNPEQKASVFISTYRILESCKNYAVDSNTKAKVECFLDEAKEVYSDIFPIVIKYQNLKREFGKARLLNEIINIITDVDKNQKINLIVDLFLVFGEKIELFDVNNVSGVDMDNESGKEIVKDLRKSIKESKN